MLLVIHWNSCQKCTWMLFSKLLRQLLNKSYMLVDRGKQLNQNVSINIKPTEKSDYLNSLISVLVVFCSKQFIRNEATTVRRESVSSYLRIPGCHEFHAPYPPYPLTLQANIDGCKYTAAQFEPSRHVLREMINLKKQTMISCRTTYLFALPKQCRRYPRSPIPGFAEVFYRALWRYPSDQHQHYSAPRLAADLGPPAPGMRARSERAFEAD